MKHTGSSLCQLCLSGFDGKVGLGAGNLNLAWIAIHRNEIASVPSEMIVFDKSVCALARLYHLVGFPKVIIWSLSAVATGDHRPLDGVGKFAPVLVAQ